MLTKSYRTAKIKDVVTAKSIEFSDKYENLGVQLVRHVANKTSYVAGDGTTPATILGRAIFNEDGTVAAGLNQIDVKHGIDQAANHVLSHLQFTAQDVTSKDTVIKVTRISSNGDKILSGHGLKGDAFEKGGNGGVVSIQDGSSFEDTLKLIEVMKFDGFTSPYCIQLQKDG